MACIGESGLARSNPCLCGGSSRRLHHGGKPHEEQDDKVHLALDVGERHVLDPRPHPPHGVSCSRPNFMASARRWRACLPGSDTRA
eukprot:157414-Prymnesium_polylepis.1